MNKDKPAKLHNKKKLSRETTRLLAEDTKKAQKKT